MIDLNNFSLNDILPASIKNNEENHALAEAITLMLQQVFDETSILDPRMPLAERLLDIVAKENHVDYYDETLSPDQKRQLIRNSWRIHRRKGTVAAIEEVVSILLDRAQIVEWFDYDGEPYFFKIEIDGPLRSEKDLPVVFRAVNANKRFSSRLEAIWFKRGEGIYYRVIYKNGKIHIHPVIAVRCGIRMPGRSTLVLSRAVSSYKNGTGAIRISGSIFSGEKENHVNVGRKNDTTLFVVEERSLGTASVPQVANELLNGFTGTATQEEVGWQSAQQAGTASPPKTSYQSSNDGVLEDALNRTQSTYKGGLSTLSFSGVTYTTKGENG
ncbi:phage tail protein I [Exiguobacterium acetylicum]|uniref:phage tail protein I n=1 Tax=Exiguobacterium acetylicum TaxID=41170 RepID=UPI001EE29A7B|nr:phage tail protein I [Exiguobacterium acetylicum]UKS54859.1 phage tail protein I [Exiguobacterium acetylicum]